MLAGGCVLFLCLFCKDNPPLPHTRRAAVEPTPTLGESGGTPPTLPKREKGAAYLSRLWWKTLRGLSTPKAKGGRDGPLRGPGAFLLSPRKRFLPSSRPAGVSSGSSPDPKKKGRADRGFSRRPTSGLFFFFLLRKGVGDPFPRSRN